MIIIGITGTNGSGKGTIVEYLISEYGFKHLSVGEYLSNQLKNKNLEVNRPNLIAVGNDIRKRFGPDYIAKTLYQKAKVSSKNCVIESLRNTSEVRVLQSKGNFYLIAVDAKPKLRYQRIQKRAEAKDKVSFGEFTKSEEKEMKSGNPYEQNLRECIKLADFKIKNNGTLKELFTQIDNVLNQVIKK